MLDIVDKVMGVNYNLQQLLQVSQEELKTCTNIGEDAILCHSPPIHKLDTKKNCAVESVHQNIDPCPHKIKHYKLDTLIWKQMLTPNTRMFITNRPRTVAVICSGNRQNDMLKATGLRQFSDQCIVDGKEHRLLPFQDRSTTIQGIFFQPVNTSFDVSLPQLEIQEDVLTATHTASEILADEMKIADQGNTWHTIHHQEARHVAIWTAGTFLVTIVILLGVLWYVKHPRVSHSHPIVDTIELRDP